MDRRLFFRRLKAKQSIPSRVRMPFMSRPKILRTYAEYDDSSPAEPIAVTYKLFEPLPDVLQKYDYPKYVEGFSQTDDGLAFSLLRLSATISGITETSGIPKRRAWKTRFGIASSTVPSTAGGWPFCWRGFCG